VAVPAARRAYLESVLRDRQLDRTLTTAIPDFRPGDDRAFAQTGITAIDASLGGGLMRGHLSEIVGPRSSGRTAVVVSALVAASHRGEAVALIDPLDQFDPPSAADAGLDVTRLLWVRGQPGGARLSGRVSLPREWGDTHVMLERALKAMSLVLQAGNFGLVVLDAAEMPPPVLRRAPFTTWLRLQRGIEGSETVGLLAACEPIARSTLGATIVLSHGGGSNVGRTDAGRTDVGRTDVGRTFRSGPCRASRQFAARPIRARVVQPRRTRTETELEMNLGAVIT
jgi:hypothetical protein